MLPGILMKNSNSNEPQLSDLKVVLTLIEDSTVTRAAERLGVTQSALSYQLERMRKRFADPLFVRVGNRMAPTPFAQRLADPAARVLRIVETEIAGLTAFDPSSTHREFRIGLNEMGAITLLPKLVQLMTAAAPQARLIPVYVDVASMAHALESGLMDVAAGHFPQTHDLLVRQLLYRRDYVCVARRDHPTIGKSVTLQQFSQTPQIETPALQATKNWLSVQLREHDLQTSVHIHTQHVASIPFIVAASDSVAVIPRELFELFSPIAAIKVVDLPIQIPAIDIHQHWHPRVASDPAIKFLRGLMFQAAGHPSEGSTHNDIAG
jgi:DNA-binding transcriptional LysR family regulator